MEQFDLDSLDVRVKQYTDIGGGEQPQTTTGCLAYSIIMSAKSSRKCGDWVSIATSVIISVVKSIESNGE